MVVTTCKRLQLLPNHHFGARPGHTTTDSVHLLVKMVKGSWRKSQVSSALFLGVKGTFPSIDINRLIHNMRKLGFLVEFTKWFLRQLTDRQTCLIFDDYQTLSFIIGNGLDQGDLFSGIAYLIYNADLPKIADSKLSKRILLFVDNSAIIVTGKSLTDTHKKLHNIMERTNSILAWANTHISIKKFQLLDFTKKIEPHPFIRKKRIPVHQTALKIGDHCIPSKDTAKFLRVILDNKLNWKSHGATALAKGQDWLFKLGCISKTYKGTHAKQIRQIYLAVAVPHMLYAADVFLTPHTRVGRRQGDGKYTQAIAKKLASIQRGAVLLITGALRSTTTDAVETLVGLLPFHLLIDKLRYSAAIWLATLPSMHPLHKPVTNAASRLIKQHPTPLHDLMHRYGIQPATMEKITPRRFHADWKPHHVIQIIKDRKLTIRSIAHDNPDLKIFTDGSGINDKIGASAVLYQNNRKKATLRYVLGLTNHHTVYKGESCGTLLATKLIMNKTNVDSVIIYTDNRATIIASTLTKPSPGH